MKRGVSNGAQNYIEYNMYIPIDNRVIHVTRIYHKDLLPNFPYTHYINIIGNLTIRLLVPNSKNNEVSVVKRGKMQWCEYKLVRQQSFIQIQACKHS